jgi:DegV family protein with EDD domain
MAAVRIVTDSACDLSDEEVARHGIAIVPLTIRFGSEEFVDRVELSTHQFYEKLASSPDVPQTAAPAPGAFAAAFRTLKDEGASEIVCINLSSALSATMQAAQNGAAAVADEIAVRVVDSKSITGGLGTIVVRAAEAAAGGATADEVVAVAADLSARQRIYGTLDTLENLKKGGRIGGAQALLGSMLSIKPLVDLSSGAVEEAGRTRTRKKAFAWLRDEVVKAGKIENLRVIHGEAPDIDEFLALLGEQVDLAGVQMSTIGAVIGAHGGPRVVGVAFHVVGSRG